MFILLKYLISFVDATTKALISVAKSPDLFHNLFSLAGTPVPLSPAIQYGGRSEVLNESE